MKNLLANYRVFEWIILPVVIGVVSVFINKMLGIYILDPLVVALVVGCIVGSFIKFRNFSKAAFSRTANILLPIGVFFYGAANLNFNNVNSISAINIIILIIVFFVYVISTIIIANLLKVREIETYLVAIGSAVCGASAIAIASKALNAKDREISISLISVFISALIGIFIVIPFIIRLFGYSEMTHAICAGTTVQFTGFVKQSVFGLSPQIKNLAISIKAVRYIALILLIPLFASLVRGKFYIPWFLWGFIFTGIIFSLFPEKTIGIKSYCNITLSYLWSFAMAAIGLNTNIRSLFTTRGVKLLFVCIMSFIIAISVFIFLENLI